MTRYFAVLLPMFLGAVIGFAAAHYGSWPAVVGMASGAACWMAYEMRIHSRRMDEQLKHFERESERMQEQAETIALRMQYRMRPDDDQPWMMH